MSRPNRFFLSGCLSIGAFLCFFAALNGALFAMAVTQSAPLRFVYWAGTLAMYLLLTLTLYVVIGQIFPPDDDVYPPEQRITIATVGATMLIVGVALVIVSYLNLWAADDYFAYRACIETASDCSAGTGVWAIIGLRYGGFGLVGVSLPVLLVGLIVNGLEGWG